MWKLLICLLLFHQQLCDKFQIFIEGLGIHISDSDENFLSDDKVQEWDFIC